jgi:adenylate cyclase
MQMNMKAPIGIKIFSIAVSLVLLMTIVSALSTRNIAEVSRQVNALSEFYLPMQRAIEDARVSTTRQVVNLERMLYTRTAGRGGKAQLDELEARFEQRGAQADEQIRRAIAIADKAIKGGRLPPDEAKLLERLRDRELPDLVEARRHLHTTTVSYVKEMDAGDARAAQLFRQVVNDERDRVGKAVDDAVAVLAALVQSSAATADARERSALALNWGLTIAAALLGLALAAFVTRGLVRPVKDLVAGTKAVERGDFDVRVNVQTQDELADLASSFNQMVSQIREKRAITETFGKYVDPRIVKRLLETKDVALQGERRVMTVFFSDIAGFTTLCETLTPDGAVRCLNQYFTLASAPIRAANGIIDKFIGDAIMAFWGPPFTGEAEHALLACRTALAQLDTAKELKRVLSDTLGLRKGVPEMNARVGLATGEVTVGSIGSDTTKGYTVIGDTVNLASRLESVNKFYGTRLLISEATREMAGAAIEVREIDSIRVKGKNDAVRVYELLALKDALAPQAAKLRDEFQAGLAEYRRSSWDSAEARFRACLALDPGDGPARVYLERVSQFRKNPPSPDWSGVWTLSEK